MKKILLLIVIVGFVACNNYSAMPHTAEAMEKVNNIEKEIEILDEYLENPTNEESVMKMLKSLKKSFEAEGYNYEKTILSFIENDTFNNEEFAKLGTNQFYFFIPSAYLENNKSHLLIKSGILSQKTIDLFKEL